MFGVGVVAISDGVRKYNSGSIVRETDLGGSTGMDATYPHFLTGHTVSHLPAAHMLGKLTVFFYLSIIVFGTTV